jgi:putative PIN family toxin of toxin-antitoxin system
VRLVLDTCVIASAFRSRNGASRALLDLLYARRFLAPTSQALFLEYETVLSRPEQRAIHQFSDERLEALLRDLSDFITPVTIRYQYRPQLRDPGDEHVLEAAINGYADAIVTHNVRDFLPATSDFGIEVLTPGSILRQRLRP